MTIFVVNVSVDHGNNKMLFMVNINVVHGKWQCCSWAMSLFFIVKGNVVHGQIQNPLGYINLNQ